MAVPGTVASDWAGVTVIWSAGAADAADVLDVADMANVADVADALRPAAMLAVPGVSTASALPSGTMSDMATIRRRARRETRGGRSWDSPNWETRSGRSWNSRCLGSRNWDGRSLGSRSRTGIASSSTRAPVPSRPDPGPDALGGRPAAERTGSGAGARRRDTCKPRRTPTRAERIRAGRRPVKAASAHCPRPHPFRWSRAAKERWGHEST